MKLSKFAGFNYSLAANMETQTMERDDTSSTKTGDIIQHHENEKGLTESPVELVSPVAEHVTAKTWIVIFVSFTAPQQTSTGELRTDAV